MTTQNMLLSNYLNNIKHYVIHYACSKWYDVLMSNNMDYNTLMNIYNNDVCIRYKQKKFYTHFKHIIVWYENSYMMDTFIQYPIPDNLFIDLFNWNKDSVHHQTGKELLFIENIVGSQQLYLTTISTILESISWNQFNLYLDNYYNITCLK